MGALAVMMSGSVWIEHSSIGVHVRELKSCWLWARTSQAARPSRWVDGPRPAGTRRRILLGSVSPWAGRLQSRGASPLPWPLVWALVLLMLGEGKANLENGACPTHTLHSRLVLRFAVETWHKHLVS